MRPEIIERFVAIDNYCTWPNLTLLPDGTIAAIVYNQPTDGRWEGDVECSPVATARPNTVVISGS